MTDPIPLDEMTSDALDELHERLAKAENAIAQIRRLCQMTIDVSVRAHAIQQARDTLALIDAPITPAYDGPSIAECRDADRRWPLEKEGE